MDNFSVLPEGCISQILSMTSPRDACRSSAISSGFDAAANSDSVWEKFLPSDYRQIISRSVSPVVFSTKKQLYFSLCDSPLLLDGGKLSFALDRESGKKCYTLPAREIAIAWKENSQYWKWISLPESRFPDIWGRISTAMLSPNTTYTAYVIFKIADQRDTGLELLTVFLTLWMMRSVGGGQNGRLPQTRKDGWMEIELGEFYDDVVDDGEVEMRLREVSSWKTGLIVEGIEVRPKVGV